MGWVTVVDPRNGPDDMNMARRIGKRMYRDPYPVSKEHFLVADDRGILVGLSPCRVGSKQKSDQNREQDLFHVGYPLQNTARAMNGMRTKSPGEVAFVIEWRS